MSDAEEKILSDLVEEIVRNKASDVPVIYFDGFSNRATSSDIEIVLMHNGVSVGMLSGSHAIMKTFAKALTESIEGLEETLGQPLLSSREILNKMKEASNDSSDK